MENDKLNDKLKVADVMLVFGKEDPNNKANYRPISLLSVILKIFERVLFGYTEKFAKKKRNPITKIVYF